MKHSGSYKFHPVSLRISPYGTPTRGIVLLEFSQSGSGKVLGYASQSPLD
jgi:hypothetical protein